MKTKSNFLDAIIDDYVVSKNNNFEEKNLCMWFYLKKTLGPIPSFTSDAAMYGYRGWCAGTTDIHDGLGLLIWLTLPNTADILHCRHESVIEM